MKETDEQISLKKIAKTKKEYVNSYHNGRKMLCIVQNMSQIWIGHLDIYKILTFNKVPFGRVVNPLLLTKIMKRLLDCV